MTQYQPPRRESRTERKQYKFRPSVARLLEATLAARGKDSETEVVEIALLKELNAVPLLGEIACGDFSDLPEGSIEEWVNVGDLFKVRQGDYFLKARGSSMTGGGVYDGDLILIRPQQTCDNNDVAAVMIQGPVGPMTTLKRVQFTAGSKVVCLSPMNPAHDSIEIDTEKDELRICGVKRGVIHMD